MTAAIGVDIGTTTISINLIEKQSGAVIQSVTLPNHSSLKRGEQDLFSDSVSYTHLDVYKRQPICCRTQALNMFLQKPAGYASALRKILRQRLHYRIRNSIGKRGEC